MWLLEVAQDGGCSKLENLLSEESVWLQLLPMWPSGNQGHWSQILCLSRETRNLNFLIPSIFKNKVVVLKKLRTCYILLS